MKNLFCLFTLLFAFTQVNATFLPQLLGVQNTTKATVYVERGDDFKIEVFTDNEASSTVVAELIGGLIVLSEVPNAFNSSPSIIKITMPSLIHAENRNTGSIVTSDAFINSPQKQMVIINRGKGDMYVHSTSQKLMVCNTGSGQIKVSGQSETLESHCIGSGKIKFQDFATKSAKTHSATDIAQAVSNKHSYNLPLLNRAINVQQ